MACILGTGGSGIVSVYEPDPNYVLKGYEVWHGGRCISRYTPIEDSIKSLAREDTVYQRLKSHPNMLHYEGQVSVAPDTHKPACSLKLERAESDLRSFMARNTAPADYIRLDMALQTSNTMAYIHSKGVFHGDFSCRNIFIFPDWVLKVGDFGAAWIDGQRGPGGEEVRYQLPLRGRDWEDMDQTKCEVFALGCAIYEIMAWKKPFYDLTDDQIEKNYADEVFPDTDDLRVGDVIRACWNEEFETAGDVEKALREQLGKEARV